jgi:hypothetical protein
MVDREALLVWSFANEQLKGLGEVVVVSTEELISLCWMDVTVVWVTYFTRFVDGGILPCRECLAMQTCRVFGTDSWLLLVWLRASSREKVFSCCDCRTARDVVARPMRK